MPFFLFSYINTKIKKKCLSINKGNIFSTKQNNFFQNFFTNAMSAICLWQNYLNFARIFSGFQNCGKSEFYRSTFLLTEKCTPCESYRGTYVVYSKACFCERIFTKVLNMAFPRRT